MDVAQSGSVCGVQLTVQCVRRIALAQKQIAVEASEIAINDLVPHNGLDLVNRRRVAFGGQAASFLAVNLFDFEKAIVNGVGKMGRSSLGLATRDRPVV